MLVPIGKIRIKPLPLGHVTFLRIHQKSEVVEKLRQLKRHIHQLKSTIHQFTTIKNPVNTELRPINNPKNFKNDEKEFVIIWFAFSSNVVMW